MQIVGKPQVSNRAFVWHPRQRLPKGDLLFCTLRQGPEMSQIFVILRWCQTCQKWFHHMLCLLRCVTRSFAAKPQPDIHITQLLEVWRFWNLWNKRNESILEVYEMKEVKEDVVLICFIEALTISILSILSILCSRSERCTWGDWGALCTKSAKWC